jgi:putative ABC transport system substrate-binding protein
MVDLMARSCVPRLVAAFLSLSLVLVLVSRVADAQQAAKVARIGVLRPAPVRQLEDALREGLREHGYVEGQNVVIEWRFSGGRNERFVDLAGELARLPVDVIVTSGTPATGAAQRATSTIPIVMVAVGDPVGSGFVTNLARPNRNITGSSLYSDTQTVGKRLGLLKETVPNASRVAVLWNPTNPFEMVAFKQLRKAAGVLGLILQSVEVGDPGGFERAFSAIAREGANALYVSEGHLNFTHRHRISQLAAGAPVPAVYGLREFVEAGGLMAYAASISDQYRRTAMYVARILGGAKPADLPVDQPVKYELVLNVKAARALAITFPSSLLLQADHVIE